MVGNYIYIFAKKKKTALRLTIHCQNAGITVSLSIKQIKKKKESGEFHEEKHTKVNVY